MKTDYNTLLFDYAEGVATITLNRPDKANAMNVALMEELLAVANTCDLNPEVRVVVLTAGGKYFSVGGDLDDFYNSDEGVEHGVKQATTFFHSALSRLVRMKKPLIVGVNGTAAGAGFSLAVLGDYVIAADSAKFTMSYTRAGLSPDGGATFSLPRIVGLRRAAELMLMNKMLDAGQALDWGLVNEVVPDGELAETVSRIAGELAAGPTLAFGSVKQLLQESATSSIETQLEREAREIVANAGRNDGREGMAAFLEKRQPSFSGK
ncbi:MAG: enoyl-CoA hydratase-related protein [Gammaproteobacteria bacterium]